jgi:hypothetical protein
VWRLGFRKDKVIAVRKDLYQVEGKYEVGIFGRDVMLQTVRGQTAAVTGRDNVTDWLQVFIYSDCTNSCT